MDLVWAYNVFNTHKALINVEYYTSMAAFITKTGCWN